MLKRKGKLIQILLGGLAILLFAGFLTLRSADSKTVKAEGTAIDLSVYDNMHWELAAYDANTDTYAPSGGYVLGSDVYVYSYTVGSDVEAVNNFYSESPVFYAPDPQWGNWKFVEQIRLSNSAAVWNGSERALAILNPQNYTVSDYANNRYTNADGAYYAEAVLTAAENFTFTSSEVNRDELDARGISIAIDENGKRAVVTKTWYIVHSVNNLLDGNSSSDEVVDFKMPSWEFGKIDGSDNVEFVPMPYLSYGDERFFEYEQTDANYEVRLAFAPSEGDPDESAADPSRIVWRDFDGSYAVADGWLDSITAGSKDADDFLTFRLVRISGAGTEEELCANGNRSQWQYYFNRYMPVGKYAVTIKVKSLSMNGNCALWWGASVNSQAVFQGIEHTFEFEVTPAQLEICDPEFSLTPLNVTAFEEKDFAAIVNEIVGTVGVQPDSTSIFTEAEIRSRGGYWADYAEQSYDYEPKLVYNLSLFYSNDYFAAEERDDWNDYLATPATHRIFYNVTMKNYVWNVDMALHKYDYYFDLVVYEELPVPVLRNGGVYEYTGAPISAAPTDTSAEYLSKFTIRNGTATDAGEDYIVTFLLKDAEHYKWSNRELGVAQCELSYAIQKAKVRVPQSGSVVYTGEPLSPFEIPDNIHGNPVFRIVGEAQPVFVEADEYEIELQLTDTGNYEWITSDGNDQVTGSVDGKIQITFTILAAADSWTQSLRINNWEYRGFRPDVNFFAAALASGKTVKYAVATDPDDEATVIGGLNGFSLVGNALPSAAETALIGLERGTYYICAYTDEEDNYAPANSGWISFEVTQARNEWVSEPRADGWSWGSYNAGTVVINGGQPKFGTVSLVYYKLGTDGTPTDEGHASLTDFDAGNAGSYIGIPAGNYRMAVTVEGTENYTGFSETREIRVEKGENRWEITPNVQSWIYGSPIAISGEALYGDVNLVIKSGATVVYSGSLNAADSDQSLRRALPGEYEFSATVSEGGNWYGLVYNGGFRISSPNNNGWLIAPSIANWTVGEIPNDGDALPLFNAANMQRWYETDDGTRLAAKPETAGDYYFVAFVPAYTDESGVTYDELTARVRFTVYSKPIALNGWKIAPNIQGWREGDTPNEPVGEADAGSVVFTYRTADGTLLDAKPVTAGSYVLVASVTAEGYADLTAEIGFTIAVAPVSINQTAQDSTGTPVYITIDGVRAGSSVTFEEIANNDANAGFWKRTAQTFADLGYAVGAVYNITLIDANGTAVQPDGTVTVTLSVPRWLQNKGGLQIAYLNEFGAAELMGGVVSGDKITFTTTHFSNYCFVWAEASGKDAAQTGWAIFLTVIVEVCVVAALATTVAVFIVIWKRKKAAAGVVPELEEKPSAEKKKDNKVAEKQSGGEEPKPAEKQKSGLKGIFKKK